MNAVTAKILSHLYCIHITGMDKNPQLTFNWSPQVAFNIDIVHGTGLKKITRAHCKVRKLGGGCPAVHVAMLSPKRAPFYEKEKLDFVGLC